MSKTKIKRLYFDIETSPNLVHSWNVGYKLNIDHSNIVKERAIICICYKWEGESKVHYFTWNNGNDKQLILDFFKVIEKADEIIGHNGDKFDLPWFRTRCIFHGVSSMPEFITIDTLKESRSKFRFNSNKLDYIAQFLGLGKKMSTGGYDLWKRIILDNDKSAMNKMVKYCQKDVILLEKVYKKLSGYIKPKLNVAVLEGNKAYDCPHCGSGNTQARGVYTTVLGTIKHKLQCNDCRKYYRISQTLFNKRQEDKED